MTQMIRLGVLASGRGSNLQAIIDAIEAETVTANVAVVISNNERAPALTRAARHGVPSVFLDPRFAADAPDPREAYDRQLLEQLKRYEVEFVILAGYMKIVTPVLIRAYAWRMMNVHPSLLPSFPGLNAQRQALNHGVKVAGCTVHFVTERVDEGPIILQRAVPVHEDDTVDALSDRILKEEHRLLPEAIRLFAAGRIRVEGQRVHVRRESLDCRSENLLIE